MTGVLVRGLPRGLRDTWAPVVGRLVRYAMVSVIGVAVTQVVLLVLYGPLAVDATVANVSAVSVAAVPSFVLNRRWVWGRTHRVDHLRESLPFWAMAVAGLVLSTAAVSAAVRWRDVWWVVSAANLTGFGVVWLAKFAILERVLFAPPTRPPAGGRPGVRSAPTGGRGM